MHTFNEKLALAIPTYNRADVLEQNLRHMLPELKKFSIPVYVSDDSTNFETRDMMASLALDYPFLFYRHNVSRLGHDANFFSTLKMADTDYVWYLGDSVFVNSGGFETVLNTLKSAPDLCFVNAYVVDRKSQHLKPEQMREFLMDRTWYLTLSGATIYGRKSRALSVSETRKKQWKNFPQLGFVLEYCSVYSAHCEWLGKRILEVNKNKKSYWEQEALRVFVRDWSALIRSFPQLFSEIEATSVIRSHSERMGLFGPWGLIRLRALNVLNFQVLSEFGPDFAIASGHSAWANFLCCIPQRACWLCVSGVRMLKKILVAKHSG